MEEPKKIENNSRPQVDFFVSGFLEMPIHNPCYFTKLDFLKVVIVPKKLNNHWLLNYLLQTGYTYTSCKHIRLYVVLFCTDTIKIITTVAFYKFITIQKTERRKTQTNIAFLLTLVYRQTPKYNI